MQFLRSCYFLEISDDCKFCIIIDRNFKFSGNANRLVYCSARRKEDDCALWLAWECHENVQNLFVSLRSHNFGILFCPFWFLL